MSDYQYLPVSDGTGDASLMHITSNRSVGSTVIDVDSVIGVPLDFIACQGNLLSTGFIDPTNKTDFKGHVNSGTLVIDGFEPGSTDTGSTSGQVVVIKPNTGWANRVASFIKNATNLGTPENHTVATLTATAVATGTFSASGAVTLNGAVEVAGTSYFASQSTATADGSGNITPLSQVFRVTALAGTATIQVPSYTPQDGMTGELRISDNGTGQTLSWATGWRAVGVTLPTATTGYAFTYVSYEYSASDGKWHVLSVARG
jgi:hypothetical protein